MGMKGYGIDISENAIKFTKKYIEKWDIYTVIELYDGKKITYPNEYFDFVIMLRCIRSYEILRSSFINE